MKDRGDVNWKEEKMPFWGGELERDGEEMGPDPEASLILHFSDDHSLFNKG